jgi:hypothetical protein
MARAKRPNDEQRCGWEKIIAYEQVGKDTTELRHWRITSERSLRQRGNRS